MSDRILARYLDPKARTEAPADEQETADDLGAFGWLRGIRDRAIMLELRHRNGMISAFAYSWLERAEFDPSDGITLQFAGKTVRIAGRNLNSESRPNMRLFAGIVRHRVPWIQEADGPTALIAEKTATVVEELHVKG